MPRPVVVALLLLVAGCVTWAAPGASTLARLAPLPIAALVPGQFELELASPGLSGTFDAVCAIGKDGLRLQLFPDVGGKVVDLLVGEHTVVVDLAGTRHEVPAPFDQAAPQLGLVLAALVAELAAPVGPSRVLGERRRGDGVEVQLAPALGSGTVRARLDPAGAVAEYTIAIAGVEFTLGADGRFAGHGFAGRIGGVGAAGTSGEAGPGGPGPGGRPWRGRV